MKIAVVGSRGYKDLQFVHGIVTSLFHETKIDSFKEDIDFVSGGSSVLDKDGFETSIDKYAENIIDDLNRIYEKIYSSPIKKYIFKPKWQEFGKRAGYIRNQLIINEADKVIAFWDGKSKGTKHSINLAILAGKPVDIYVRT